LGNWKQAEQTLSDAIAILPKITNTTEYKRLFAQALDVKGQIQLSLGGAEQALDTWKQANKLYQNIEDVAGFTRSRIYQAQALQALGLYAQAIDTLTQIQQQAVIISKRSAKIIVSYRMKRCEAFLLPSCTTAKTI
jgi:tetratricopeptide (TPR) repeat protein